MITIHICVGSACHLKGSYNVINNLQRLIDKNSMGDKVTVKAALCLGKCTQAVSVRLDDNSDIISLSEKNIDEFFNKYILNQ